jgi:hypothetical protein
MGAGVGRRVQGHERLEIPLRLPPVHATSASSRSQSMCCFYLIRFRSTRQPVRRKKKRARVGFADAQSRRSSTSNRSRLKKAAPCTGQVPLFLTSPCFRTTCKFTISTFTAPLFALRIPWVKMTSDALSTLPDMSRVSPPLR